VHQHVPRGLSPFIKHEKNSLGHFIFRVGIKLSVRFVEEPNHRGTLCPLMNAALTLLLFYFNASAFLPFLAIMQETEGAGGNSHAVDGMG